jgi:hypothetical protein
MFEAPCPDGYKERYHKGTDKRKADTSIFFFSHSPWKFNLRDVGD